MGFKPQKRVRTQEVLIDWKGKAAVSRCVSRESMMKQYLLVKLGDFVISVPEGEDSSKAPGFLLPGDWILNDSLLHQKSSPIRKHYLVESGRGSRLVWLWY